MSRFSSVGPPSMQQKTKWRNVKLYGGEQVGTCTVALPNKANGGAASTLECDNSTCQSNKNLGDRGSCVYHERAHGHMRTHGRYFFLFPYQLIIFITCAPYCCYINAAAIKQVRMIHTYCILTLLPQNNHHYLRNHATIDVDIIFHGFDWVRDLIDVHVYRHR